MTKTTGARRVSVRCNLICVIQILTFFLRLLSPATMRGGRPRVVEVSSTDEEMRAAVARAKATIGEFLSVTDDDLKRTIPSLQDMLIKVYMFARDKPDNGEHIWTRYLGRHPEREGYFRGRLLSTPTVIKFSNEGDTLNFTLNSITDWLYVREGRLFGAYTIKLLRDRMNTRQRQRHDSRFPFTFEDDA